MSGLVTGGTRRRSALHGRGVRRMAAVLAAAGAELLTVVMAAGPASAAGPPSAAANVSGPSAAVCPQAPPGVQPFADQLTAWVKWAVLALLVLGALVSLASILVGRIFAHPHASRYGTMGVAVIIMVAITYTVIVVILGSITGSGCT